MRNHILITGKPGVGKTTLIQRIFRKYKPILKISGFWTSEKRIHGKRIGFGIHTTAGKLGTLARIDASQMEKEYRVGKYKVFMHDLKELAVPTLYAKCDLVLIDEIGKMEILSPEFKKAVLFTFDNQSRVLATIGYQKIAFLTSIKVRSDIELIELTAVNREEIFHDICKKLEEDSHLI
ncbi:MAG: NTPase [Candidatus Hodarchaeota archaeon]